MDAFATRTDAREYRAGAGALKSNPSIPEKLPTGSRVSTTGASARDAGAGTGHLTAEPLDRSVDRPARHAVAARARLSEAIDREPS